MNLPLFEQRAKRNDPETSAEWASDANKKLTASMNYAMGYICTYPGRTALELEALAGCKAGNIWKVIAQLERRNKIVRKRTKGERALRIWPANINPQNA